MNDDEIVVVFAHTGESKNCYIFEPEEGGDAVSKLYVRKSAFGVGAPPASIEITIREIDEDQS